VHQRLALVRSGVSYPSAKKGMNEWSGVERASITYSEGIDLAPGQCIDEVLVLRWV